MKSYSSILSKTTLLQILLYFVSYFRYKVDMDIRVGRGKSKPLITLYNISLNFFVVISDYAIYNLRR